MPQFQEFLRQHLVSENVPLQNIIRAGRERSHISRGKTGRGAVDVSPLDASVIMCALLGGDTPQAAGDALNWLMTTVPTPDNKRRKAGFKKEKAGLVSTYWNAPFPIVIGRIIDQRIKDKTYWFPRATFSVQRELCLASLGWEEAGRISYKPTAWRELTDNNSIQVEASINHSVLMQIGDALAGREFNG